jgi:two-component system NtrC family sensor kinase
MKVQVGSSGGAAGIPTDPAGARQHVVESRRFEWLDAARLSAPPSMPVDASLATWLVENITARIAVISLDQRYLYANRELLEFLGLAADRVIGRPVADVLGAAVVASYEPLRQRIHGGEALRWEGWVDYGSRGKRWLQETLVPYAPDGTVQGVVVYGRDHTALKSRELELAAKLAELEASETLKAAIVDHALAAIVTTDAQGRIVEFNPAAESMFGSDSSGVLGECVSDFLMP